MRYRSTQRTGPCHLGDLESVSPLCSPILQGNQKMNYEKRTIADGRATLYRGDCLELLRAGVFGKLGAIVSDPPYGIAFKHGGGGNGGSCQTTKTLANTGLIFGDSAPFDPSPWIESAPLSLGERGLGKYPLVVLFGADHYMQRLPTCGTMLAWDKHLGRAADDSFADCEWAWCGRKTKREVFRWLWKGVVAQKHELDMPPAAIKGGNGHGAARFARVHVSQKPVELMRWCIEKVRPLPGLPVLDPYMGSGSTGIAALSMGHSFIGCEIDPGHFEVACQRIEAAWAQMKGA